MPFKTVQLSRKITISNEDDAKRHSVERWYTEYFQELNILLKYRGVPSGGTIPVPIQLELNLSLNNSYASSFCHALTEVGAFKDLNEQPMQIDHVKLACKTFIREAANPVLLIFITTKVLHLIESFGSMLLLKDATVDNNPLLSIELTKDIMITSYSN